MLVVVCGLPGVGKSTVAAYAAARIDATRLRTDVVRKELYDDPAYTDAERRQVYDALLSRTRRQLAAGSVVADGTFGWASVRRQARAIATDAGVDYRLLKVECDPATVRERLAARHDDPSDADFSVHQAHRDTFEPIEAAHVRIDNSGAMAETQRQIDAALSTDEDEDGGGSGGDHSARGVDVD